MLTECIECRSGKHQNCDGIADWTDEDKAVPCYCEEDGHSLR